MEKRVTSPAELLAVIGVASVLVLVPLVPGRVQLGPIPLESLTFAVPLALLLCIPLLRQLGARELPRLGFEVAALAFLAIALIGIPFSTAAKASIGTWARYAGYILLVPAVAAVARKEANRRVLLWILVGAGAITAVIGVIQYLNPSTIDAIGLQGLDVSVATRIYSTYVNPNFYSEYLVLLFGATLALAFAEKGFLRGLAAGLLGLEAVALLLTYTRGSWLALVVGFVVAVLMIDARYLLTLLGAGGLGAAVVPSIRHRVLSIFSLGGTASFRLRLWRLAGTIIQRNPWLGVGMGQFVGAFKDVSLQHPELGTGYLIYGAHNSYFTIMAEAGILGGLAFVWVVVSICRMGVFYGDRMDGDMSAKLQNAALTVGLVAFAFNALTSNSFQHPQAAVFFWVLAGLQTGLGARFWTKPVEERAPISVPSKQTTGVFAGSAVLRWARGSARFLQNAWNGSHVRGWLRAAPRGNGDVLRCSWLARILFGKGRAAETESA